MGAHAVAYYKNPANNTQKKPGYYTACYLQIRNDGNERGNFYLGINKDGAECGTHIYNVFLDLNAAKNANPCEFTMPDRRVKIEYFGGHHDGKDWVEDFSDVIYIDPEVLVEEYCSQTVKVVDPTGNAISGARVHLRNGIISYLSTDTSGYGTFPRLAKDRTHYVSAEKSGYSSSETKSFIACTGTITLLLGVSCVCTGWVKQECIRDGVRRYTRTCTPSGCQPEERTISDTSCVGVVPPEEPPEAPPEPPSEELWKSVSEPYWDGDNLKIDIEAQNLIPTKKYWGSAYAGIEPFGNRPRLTPEASKATITIYEVWRIIKYYNSKVSIKLQEPCTYFARSPIECPIYDSVDKTISPQPQPAEGEIIECNINRLACPNCGKAKVGQEIEVVAQMKNIGNETGEFRFYIYDQDKNELSREPDFSYKNVAAGAEWGVKKTLTTNLNFNMIGKILNGEVKVVKQT